MIADYLIKKGINVQGFGVEQRANCPFCEDTKGHLYINDGKGAFYCHKCNKAGNIIALKKHFGDFVVKGVSASSFTTLDNDQATKYHEALNSDARKYLKAERGLTDETINRFKLGLVEKDGSKYISIPYYQDDKLVNFKYRSIDGKKFQREKGCESTLYNIDNIDRAKPVLLVEGEFDAITAYQIGFTNVISVSIGAGSFNPEWVDDFDSCLSDIYIAFDNDKKGDEGARKIASKIGNYRCKRVKLPCKDFNECVMSGYTKDGLKEAFNKTESYALPNLVHVSGIVEKLDEYFRMPDKGKGLPIDGWENFNEKLGGIRPAEITVVTGETTSGKTTFTLNMAYRLVKQGKKVMIASTEMLSANVLKKLYSMHIDKPFHMFNETEYQEAQAWFIDKPIYFVDIHGKLSIDSISEYMEYTSRKYGVEYAVLDHLHFFIDEASDRLVQEIDKFMKGLVRASLKTGVHCLLVAHPAKLKNDTGHVCMNDLKGSSAIKQDVHNIMTVWRDKAGEDKGFHRIVLDMQKVRDDAGAGGKVAFEFNMDSQTYREIYA